LRFQISDLKRKKKPRVGKSEIRNLKSEIASHTAAALAPVLAAGPHAKRTPYAPAAEQPKRQGDLDITEVGKSASMPWEADGRGWHTRDRVGRTGEPCRWDGRILAQIVGRVHGLGGFGEAGRGERGGV